MSRYIALLRAINVGGHNVKMDMLRALFEELGYTGVATFIASGNVIFEARQSPTAKLEARISKHLLKALGYEVACFIRTPAALKAIAEHQAFSPSAVSSAGAYSVAFLHCPLSNEEMLSLKELRTDIDDFRVHERQVYWLCKVKQSESKFSNTVFEKSLDVQTTFRGIRTIQRLVAKYPE